MRTDQPDNELDRVLDAALATYSNREPWPGAEQRVIARVASIQRGPRWFGTRAVQAFALAGLAIVLLVPHLDRQSANVQSVSPATGDASPRGARGGRAPRPVVERPIARLKKQPRPQAFPSPARLTQEERALVQLAVVHPELLQSVGALGEELPMKALVLEPIFIAPVMLDEQTED